MTIIGWAFMHELDILPPRSLARFLLTQQLIYKSKIEKHNISLDIFVSSTSVIAKNLHLPGEITFQLQPIPFFGSDFGICVVCSSEVDKK